MASARIHEAIAKEVNKTYNMDETLLRIGTVAPDSWRNLQDGSSFKDKFLTHFWDFRIKDGQANNYEEFFYKYFNNLSNPVYFGYLIHLIADQYWKTNIDPKYEIVDNSTHKFKLKDGSIHNDENYFGYHESIKIQKIIAKTYKLNLLPTEEKDIPNFSFKIDELDLAGLFGPKGTLSYINNELTPDKKIEESLVYEPKDIIQYIKETANFIEKELKRLEKQQIIRNKTYKIAIDIDDTLLSTKELETYYWKIFCQENPNINPNKKRTWGNPVLAKFWSEYREKMAFGEIKEGAVNSLNTLLEKGYIVDLLSARPIEKYAPLKKRLVEYFQDNNLHYNNIFLGFHSKSKFLKEQNYDLLIDNDLKNIKQAKDLGIDTILFGEKSPIYKNHQALNWNEVLSIIEQIPNLYSKNK